MKNPKKMWGFLTFTFLFMFALNVSCKHNNDDPKPAPGPTPTPEPGKKLCKVSFRPNPLNMATIKASADGVESVTTPALGSIEVEAGKTVTFEVTDINEDYLPDNWINVTSSSEDKRTATLTVAKNIMVVFKLKDKPVPMVRVNYHIVNEFDSDNIHQGLLGVIDKSAGDVTVVSGSEVPIGHGIHITANPNQFNGKHRIKQWVFTNPNMDVPNTQEDVFITVAKEHIETGINFTVEFEPGEVPDPPLPDGKVRVKAGVYLWKDLEEVNFYECGTLYSAIGEEAESQGGTNMQVDKDSTIKYRYEPNPGKELYKWEVTGIEQSALTIDSTDKNKVSFQASKDVRLKCIAKNQGMSIFSVFIMDESGKYVTDDKAKVVAKYMNDQNELVDLEVSKKYVQGPTGKNVILELMPKDPSYQIDAIEVMPTDITFDRDADNKNKFTLKNIKDDIVVKIKMKKVDTVEITIAGDEHVEEASKVKFSIAKNTSWKVLRETSNITDVQFKEGYELDKWVENSSDGADLVDTFTFQDNKTIFVKSKIKMKKLQYAVKTQLFDVAPPDNIKDVPAEKISIKATKDGTTDEVASGTLLPYGTKVNFVATIHDSNWRITRWAWPAIEDETTQQTDHTKASVTLKESDANITIFAEEVVMLTIKGDEHVKEESKVQFAVAKGSMWRMLSWNEKIQGVKFDDGYKLGKWYKGENATTGTELKDDDKFETSQTIFATSKDVNLMRFTYKVRNREWQEMEASEYKVKAVKEGTTEEVANGSDVQKGTKITIEVTFTNNTRLKVRYWEPSNAEIDATNLNKAIVTVGDGDLNVGMTAEETIQLTIKGDEHLKDESKKTHTIFPAYQWWLIKDGQSGYEAFPQSLKFDEGFEADKYLKDNESGAELQWDEKVDKDMTVYIKTKKKE